MILLCGIPSEPPVRLAIDAAEGFGAEYRVLNQRMAGEADVVLEARAGRLQGRLWLAGEEIDLRCIDGIYLRLMEAELLPEYQNPPPADPHSAARAAAVTALLTEWCEVTPHRVANRVSAMSSNASKPYQAQLIARCGLAVPPLVVTSDPAEAREFADAHGKVVYKSTSSVRSIVRVLESDRRGELGRLRQLPTQFQALVTGTNVRAHVIGDLVLACTITSMTVDYRYPAGGPLEMNPTALPSEVEDACVRVATTLDLPFCGLDLIVDECGGWWCLEANPSPAYNCFEEPTGLPIAAALVRWLEAGDARPARSLRMTGEGGNATMVQVVENWAYIVGRVGPLPPPDGAADVTSWVDVEEARDVDDWPNLLKQYVGQRLELHIPTRAAGSWHAGSRMRLRARLAGPGSVWVGSDAEDLQPAEQ